MSTDLLASIEALAIDPPGARVTFVDRLAAENGWRRAYAADVLREYRRFLYLAATTGSMTPSDAVDQAWHLHLSYTRSYWDDLCGAILGQPLHHGPTQGGADEANRYRRQYEATLTRYAEVFSEDPPAAIWPAPEDRFAGSFVRADRRTQWIIPRRRAALCALPAAAVLSMAAAAEGPLYLPMVLIAVILLAVAAVGVWRTQETKRRRAADGGDGGELGVSADGGDCDAGDCSGCGGGCGGGD
jgi:hypothetical protein